MGARRLLRAGLLLCCLSCLLDAAHTAGWGPRARRVLAARKGLPISSGRRHTHVTENHRSWLYKFKNYLQDHIKNSIPPGAILAFLLITIVMGVLCCLTILVGEPVQ
ncbi:small integral membrane protein 9 [Hyaena hyaena]|uniref:small integral membrane protein 9 n=1 Tax=Hyaena hyaena TaxID=95912 RepID=UPI0019230C6A|nr:small integral membrane protein 9 [Hyaena hyaena]